MFLKMYTIGSDKNAAIVRSILREEAKDGVFSNAEVLLTLHSFMEEHIWDDAINVFFASHKNSGWFMSFIHGTEPEVLLVNDDHYLWHEHDHEICIYRSKDKLKTLKYENRADMVMATQLVGTNSIKIYIGQLYEAAPFLTKIGHKLQFLKKRY